MKNKEKKEKKEKQAMKEEEEELKGENEKEGEERKKEMEVLFDKMKPQKMRFEKWNKTRGRETNEKLIK